MKISVLTSVLGLALFTTVLLVTVSARPGSTAPEPSGAPNGPGITAANGSLVQLRFAGQLVGKGHVVEVELDRGPEFELFALHVHLAPGTTGTELAHLVHRRLGRAGVSPQLAEAPGGSAATVWIDGVHGLALRLGAGLDATVTTAEGAPSLIRLVDHSAIPGNASVWVSATAALPRPGQAPLRSVSSVSVELPDGTSAAAAARLLWEAVDQTWMTERPGVDHWRPIKLLDGSLFTGLSIGLQGKADRRLELTL